VESVYVKITMRPLPCEFQRLRKVIKMALLNVIRPLSRLPCVTLIKTQPEGGFTDTTAIHPNSPSVFLQHCSRPTVLVATEMLVIKLN